MTEYDTLKSQKDELVRQELEQVKAGISERISALQVTMKNLIAELDRRYKESIGKWNTDADMYEQGKADAYDMAEQLIKSYLNDWKSTTFEQDHYRGDLPIKTTGSESNVHS